LTIVACLKVSPDTAQLRADPDSRAPRLDEAPRRIGTFDENALEEAVRLKERHGGKVVTLSLLSEAPPPELVLRVLAMGADEAYLVQEPTVANADSLATAILLAAALRKLEPWDLVLCGEGSIDDYSRQVGPRVAEALAVPVLTQVTRVETRDDDRFVIHRSLEDRTLVVEVAPHAVVTVGQEINEARYPTVLQIMGASRKPTLRWTLADLGLAEGTTATGLSGLRTIDVLAPRDERQRVAIGGDRVEQVAAELARHLFEQGLVRVE
jgi:electron transfer flavoprotein beta subunit